MIFREIEVKSILNKKKKRDEWFLDEYTVNPYSACSFNCLYCYIRGSKYGTFMEEKLSVKKNAAELLEKQLSLRARKNQYGFIVLSSATDPYLQAEEKYLLTRKLLEIILKYHFPVHIITKSDLVTRDFDLLKKIGEQAILPKDLKDKISSGCIITFSFSTTDERIAKIFEPGATPPALRLEAMKNAAENNFKTGVSLMPVLPFISDTTENLEKMFALFKDSGAKYILPSSLTLFGNGEHDSKTLVLNAVKKHFPEFEGKYRFLFGNNYETDFNYRKEFYQKIKMMQEKSKIKNSIL